MYYNYSTHIDVPPSAHLTKRKSRLKIYNGNNVFLNDGDNFEIELHNPKHRPVLAKVKLNGEYISTAGVVIKPGQRFFLERFLDTNNKFQFSTYDVKDNSTNRSAIALNGLVEIEFYNEQQVINYPHLNGRSWSTGHSWGNGITFTTTSSNISYDSNITSMLRSNTIETGRVEKGDGSSQNFTNSYENFDYFVSKRYEYKILPYSQKNKTSEEIKQYCTECGVKVKKNFKFCPSCGNKL